MRETTLSSGAVINQVQEETSNEGLVIVVGEVTLYPHSETQIYTVCGSIDKLMWDPQTVTLTNTLFVVPATT